MELIKQQFTRLYRPKTFDEVVSQREAVSVLQNAVKNENLLNFIILEGVRGSGKCIDEDTYILTDAGYTKAICLKPTSDLGEFTFEIPLVNRFGKRELTQYYYSNGQQPCIRFVTSKGFEEVVTLNHPLRVLTAEGNIVFRKASEIKSTDRLQIRLTNQHDNSFVNINRGFMFAETYSLLLGGASVERAIERTLEMFKTESQETKQWLSNYSDFLSRDYFVLDVLSLPRRAQAAFIQRFFNYRAIQHSDKGVYFEVPSLSSEMSKQLQLMLLNFNVLTRREKISSTTYTLFVENQFYNALIENTSLARVNFKNWPDSLTSETREDMVADKYSLPEGFELFRSPKIDSHLKNIFTGVSLSTAAKELLQEIDYSYFDTIQSSEFAGVRPTLDFCMPQSHTFIAAGIVNHNTTLARIYAKAVNCKHPVDGNPCLECENCKEIEEGNSQDILEMDAASKRTIEDVRQLIKQLDYQTFSLPYRVVILDEVHMLTNEAWQALLKTLEEPRDNCIFILCTTNIEKVLDTIISRAVRLTVRRVRAADMQERLEDICKKVGVNYEPRAIYTIARKSGGIMRDAVKDLNTVYSVFNGEITLKNTQSIFSVVDTQVVLDYIRTVFLEDTSVVLNETRQIENLFVNSQRFLELLYTTILSLVKLKLHVDITEEYGQDEIAEMNRLIQDIPSKFLWKFLRVIKEQLSDFNPELPVLDYISIKMKEEEVEDALGTNTEKKEEKKANESKGFNLEAALDDI